MRATRPALLLALLVIVAVAAPAARARLPEPVPCRGGPCFAPSPGSEWQWQIAGGPARNVAGIELYDVDMFDNRRTDVARLGSDGAAVICYIDVGTVERWRPDVERFRPRPRG